MNPEDPRLANVTRFYDFWMYTIGFVEPEKESLVDLVSLSAITISEDVAKAARFSKLNIGKNGYTIKFRLDLNGVAELFPDYTTGSDDVPDHTKLVYELTDSDIANVVTFLKTIMAHELSRHYDQLTSEEQTTYTDKKVQIQKEIDECDDILSCNLLLHNRYGFAAHNHVIDEHDLGSCEFDLSTPKLEIRAGIRRDWP